MTRFRSLLPVAVTAVAASVFAIGAPAHGDPVVDKVVVIGLDGLMYSRALDASAPNLTGLAAQGLLSRSSIKGHITVSGPSWSTVLTGVWDTKHGVKNNDFTAAPFDKYPSVFTQIEKADSTRKTASVATWNKIATIAGSGTPHADVNTVTPAVPGDTDESKTDANTASGAVVAIADGDDFVFTHLDQVDGAGHKSGSASPAYLDAITRVDAQVGKIVAAVDARAASHTTERWTILVTSDHGHTPTGGHGGQSTAETENFVIARGPGFTPGATRTDYTIVDITPTVADIIGVPASSGFDGVSMRSGGPGNPSTGSAQLPTGS
ncbi:alkaline phosphatase family protein [Nocardia crassostreae]|uniref:alkaline phosphatase family protein n=1 Tax=Nocardia crassostreae TaxID=53428 RepID=UPI0008362BB0|nr:alkaline phosphatase family protein [Nocardia crassostreae]